MVAVCVVCVCVLSSMNNEISFKSRLAICANSAVCVGKVNFL